MMRREEPLVSVVVCAYNEEKLLHTCLRSLVSQTYPKERFEILVIDDESEDRTFAIAESFIGGLAVSAPRVRVIRIRHGGLSIARNSGIQLSEAEIIGFIDGDAVADPSWLVELAKPFLDGADYVGGRINLLNIDSPVAIFLQRTRHRQFFGPGIFNDQFIGCNMAFRKKVFDAVGGFDENFVARGDESSLREKIRAQFRYAAAPDAVVLHERPNTILGQVRVEWKSATLSSLVAKSTGTKLNWKSLYIATERFLMFLFAPLLFHVWLAPMLLVVPLLLSALAVLRRLYIRPLNRAIAKGLIRNYGLLHGTVGHVLYCFAQDTIFFLGGLLSPWLHRNAKIVPPMTTPVRILKTVDSRAESV